MTFSGTLQEDCRGGKEVWRQSDQMADREIDTTDDSQRITSIHRLQEYHTLTTGLSPFTRDRVLPALTGRCFHIPGNTYRQDLIQYVFHNHLLLGLCWRHPRHPVTTRPRLVHLVGSIAMGVLVTNLLWLRQILDELQYLVSDNENDNGHWSLWNNNGGRNWTEIPIDAWVPWRAESNETVVADQTVSPSSTTGSSITTGILLLWTIGGLFHAGFDHTCWMLTALDCGGRGQGSSVSRAIVLVTVLFVLALASGVVVARAVWEAENREDLVGWTFSGDNSTAAGDGPYLLQPHHVTLYASFLMSYGAELAMALLLYEPVLAYMFFAGWFSCCCCFVQCKELVPFLGGWAYEVRQEELQEKRCRKMGLDPTTMLPTMDDSLSSVDV